MKILHLDLPYKLPADSKEDINELTATYVQSAINLKYPQGLEGQVRRLWGRVQRKIDSALEEKKNEVELEDSEFDFIKKAVLDETIKFPAHIAKYINVLEEELEKLAKTE